MLIAETVEDIFLHTILTGQQQQKLSARRSTTFTGHDITIGALVILYILLIQNINRKLPLSDARLRCTGLVDRIKEWVKALL